MRRVVGHTVRHGPGGSPVPSQEDFPHPELEWRTIETTHFQVHFHQGAERTARVVAKIAEEIYGPVTAFYRHEPDSKVSFVIRDYDDIANGAAYFYDNKIEIYASNMDFELRGTHNWLRNVVTHEFTHIVQIQTSMKMGRTVPSIYFQWLNYEDERRPDVLYGYPNTVVSYPISGFSVPAWFAEGVCAVQPSGAAVRLLGRASRHDPPFLRPGREHARLGGDGGIRQDEPGERVCLQCGFCLRLLHRPAIRRGEAA